MNTAALGVMAKLGPRVLNTAGKSRLLILIYHRVVPSADFLRPGEPTVAEFDWQMRLLREYFNPLPLLEAAQRLQENSIPERAVCVTFDDGYADNEQLALPILKKYGIPATVFVSTGFLNGGLMWNDSVIEAVRNCSASVLDLQDIGLQSYPLDSDSSRFTAVENILRAIKHEAPAAREKLVAQISDKSLNMPRDLMMTDQQVRNLAAGNIEIGAHTVNHPILASVSEQEADDEIRGSKAYLEDLLQKDILSFAYPNGKPEADYTEVHRHICQDLGFQVALSTHWGAAVSESDRYQLPRFTPWDRAPFRFALRLLLSYRRIDPLTL